MFGICDVKDWITIAEYADISELLQINNIFMLEDYLVLQNTSEAVDDFFFVYVENAGYADFCRL